MLVLIITPLIIYSSYNHTFWTGYILVLFFFFKYEGDLVDPPSVENAISFISCRGDGFASSRLHLLLKSSRNNAHALCYFI